jgi:lysyl-tRNA synthetase class 2
LIADNFLEVETSMLEHQAGGATATPFKTFHEALSLDLFLRIAPELNLKKMLIGGFPQVFEIGRCFRNEGIDATHNPEFTMLEWYASFSDATKERARVEKLFKTITEQALGQLTFTHDGEVINLDQPFAVMKYCDLLEKETGIANLLEISLADLTAKAESLGLSVDPAFPREKVIDLIYKKICRPKLIQPTFLIDYPAEFAPLCKRKEEDGRLIDRFQLVVGGIEVVNAYSELNDPLDQRSRFEEQEKNKAKGDTEAQPKDEEFLEALEYGMPPAGGVGIGLDRLVMLLTDTHNIREVVYFPTLRPRE